MGCCPPRSLVSEFLYAPHTSWMTAAWGSSRDNAVRGGGRRRGDTFSPDPGKRGRQRAQGLRLRILGGQTPQGGKTSPAIK